VPGASWAAKGGPAVAYIRFPPKMCKRNRGTVYRKLSQTGIQGMLEEVNRTPNNITDTRVLNSIASCSGSSCFVYWKLNDCEVLCLAMTLWIILRQSYGPINGCQRFSICRRLGSVGSGPSRDGLGLVCARVGGGWAGLSCAATKLPECLSIMKVHTLHLSVFWRASFRTGAHRLITKLFPPNLELIANLGSKHLPVLHIPVTDRTEFDIT
jgi:hypothetical protein